MGIFRRFKEKREQKRKLRELRHFSSVFSTLDRLEQAGQLVWDQNLRRLFISHSLALTQMRSTETWTGFVGNVYLWLTFQQTQQAWNDYMLREELAAVRKVSKAKELSRDDVDRIRRARRQEIASNELEPPKLEPFEMFIVKDSTDAAAALIAVGYFDPTTNEQELALWEDIEPRLK